MGAHRANYKYCFMNNKEGLKFEVNFQNLNWLKNISGNLIEFRGCEDTYIKLKRVQNVRLNFKTQTD